MTETASGTARGQAPGSHSGRGLRVDRVYTTPGVHPYDEVSWGRRDVVLTNWRDGSVNFEQRGVEFPDFWAVNAVNIVTTKYFRGAVGSATREYSLKQLIDRVVGAYVAAGREHGYFASDADAEVFGHEITYALLHQVFSFNSPVWFNVGTASPAQVSACFILSVEDTMESILNWYREEGLIFKGGSGAGLNLSRIRSSKELLSSGGTASGPVSFMRGADASAGTIKSGGATRRAAKMVILDVDHPDIEEFIDLKAREEVKIRALRDAGFDMDLGGKDITSVQYQNANNSVRVTDEFMTAVEDGTDFALRARLDGRVLENVDARGLFRKIAEAAWACADPGLQYDDTINDWHTNPETGRITASNPCFPADQRVLTDSGLIRIGDLVSRAADGESFAAVYTNDITAEVEPADRLVATRPQRYMVTGTTEIVEIRFSDGSRLRSTPGHRVWTRNRGWVPVDQLDNDDRVVRSVRYAARPMASLELPLAAREVAARYDQLSLPQKWDEELGHYLGWLVGDGCLTNDAVTTVYGSTGDAASVLPRHQVALASWTRHHGKPSLQANGTVQLRSGKRGMRDFLTALGVTNRRAAGKLVPNSVFEAPEPALVAFLQGLFDADGCVVDQEVNGTRYVGLGSRSEELLIGVHELLGSLGIAARIYTQPAHSKFHYVRKDGSAAVYESSTTAYDLRITGHSLREFAALVGFTLPAKLARLTRVVDGHTAYDKDLAVRLASRRTVGYETTYNLTEPRNHSYVVGGVVVANCSEYLSLDNSSCNLAQLNLLKFLRDDDTFDAATFTKVVELVITAMDISICFADFPTEKITETTRAYRQLGIGYANLGALLMATGLAYDSEGGRALAAAITSLMTGTAYKRSAELAGVVGAYDGYPRNADAHQRVMRKHAAANDTARPVGADDARVLHAATAAWQEAVSIGSRNGWRNAQASVLAPTGTTGLMMSCDTTGIEPDLALVKMKKLVGGASMQIVNETIPRALNKLGYQQEQVEAIVEHVAEHGHVIDAPGLRVEHYSVFDCAMGQRAISWMGHIRMMAAVQPFVSGAISKCVVGDTIVASGDGLVRIGSLHRGEEPDSFRSEVLDVASLEGSHKTDAFYYGGVRPVKAVVLRSGHTVTGTPNHRLLVATGCGLEWRSLADLAVGDAVATQYGAEMWATVPASLRGVTVSSAYGNQKQVTLPSEMTEELAFLLGAYAAEGHTSRATWSVVITNSVDSVLERVREAWCHLFGIEARITRQPGKCPGVVVSSKTVVEFLEWMGCGARASSKRIPDAVLRSPRPMVLAFLQGLALDAYVTTRTAAKWAICLDSPELLDDLQAILTNLGVLHGRVSKYNAAYNKSYDEVYAAGFQGQLLVSLVPFLEPDKAKQAAVYLSMNFGAGSADVVPGVRGRDLYDLIPAGKPGRHGIRGYRSDFGFLLDPRSQQVSRRTLERVASVPGVQLPEWLRRVLADHLHFSSVASVEDGGEREVFDLSVPVTHAFVGNGVVNHNTVNLPESATVEDVEKAYFEGWKLGLKAIAIYRDNCKVGQPLSDLGATKRAELATTPVVEDIRPVRRRLPKKRPSQTISFAVGGAEGYLTASSYPDDGLGELFIKMSKQGSTLAGVMDAFSIAISIALQYGVPLETYVSKFTNMRFDPAGMTDDPDVRMAQSVMDYIFRRLALDYLPYEKRAELGIYSADERTAALTGSSYDVARVTEDEVDIEGMAQSAPVEQENAPSITATPADRDFGAAQEFSAQTAVDAPLCFTCGIKMRPAGSCYVCESCGSTSGCS